MSETGPRIGKAPNPELSPGYLQKFRETAEAKGLKKVPEEVKRLVLNGVTFVDPNSADDPDIPDLTHLPPEFTLRILPENASPHTGYRPDPKLGYPISYGPSSVGVCMRRDSLMIFVDGDAQINVTSDTEENRQKLKEAGYEGTDKIAEKFPLSGVEIPNQDPAMTEFLALRAEGRGVVKKE